MRREDAGGRMVFPVPAPPCGSLLPAWGALVCSDAPSLARGWASRWQPHGGTNLGASTGGGDSFLPGTESVEGAGREAKLMSRRWEGAQVAGQGAGSRQQGQR